jgi:threonyl-tRNA synthetase
MHNNYIIVIGEEEEKNNTVAVRNYKTKEQTQETLIDFLARITKEKNTKSL